MLGGPMPIRLPYSADESMLVTRRQNKLARDIDIINQKIRNNILSRSEGAMRIRFKQSEIDELQRYKASKRVPTGRLSPAPRRQQVIPRKGKPANKYNPYAEDKVNRATGPNIFDGGDIMFERASPDKRQEAYRQSTSWTEDDRAGFTSRGNDRADGRKPPQAKPDGLNPRGLLEADYYVRFLDNFEARNGKAPNSFMRKVMKANAKSNWQANKPLPSKVKKPVEEQVKETVKSVADKAKGGFMNFFKSSSSSSSSAAANEMSYDASSPKEVVAQGRTQVVVDQRKNPHARAYGPTFGKSDRTKTGGFYVIYDGEFYGPRSLLHVIHFTAWNEERGVTVKRQTKKTIRVSDFAGFGGFAGMPNHLIRNKSRALRDTALMRKRVGARINFDNPSLFGSHQSQASPRQVKRTPEPVSNLAGGLSKTRNSMQRLLK
tara:strand:- start:17959 stop:19257 length:1299 start_codon:yes stop_codon:yes gene_type:complete